MRVLLILLLNFLDCVSIRLYPPPKNGWQVWLLVCEPPEDLPGLPPLLRIEWLWVGFPGVAHLLARESKAQGFTLERLGDVPGMTAVVDA